MRYVYPAILRPEEGIGYFVFFPDLGRGATQGDGLADAVSMAKDALCLALYEMEESGEDIPAPSDTKDLDVLENDTVISLAVDTDEYREFYESKTTRQHSVGNELPMAK